MIFEKLYYVSIDLRSIFNKYGNKKITRLYLLFFYTKFRLKLLLRKAFSIHWKYEKFIGFKIYFFDYRDFFSLWREIFVWGNYYFESLNKSPLILDVGSNIGMSVLFFKFLYPDSNVLCFEPDQNAFIFLKKNIESNNLKAVKLYNVAVNNKDGSVNLHRSISSLASPGSTTIDDMYIDDKKETVQVRSLRLSKFIDKPIDFLKIDVEGSEYEIFEDIDEKLSYVKSISIEIHSGYSMKNKKVSRILSMLENNGFTYSITSAPLHHYEFARNAKSQYSIMLDAVKI